MHVSNIDVPNLIHIEFETNGIGWIGYVAELPGAFVRGRSEGECLSKVDNEIRRYFQWLGIIPGTNFSISATEALQSELHVEDADNEILLKHDRERLDDSTFGEWSQIASFSGVCFQRLYDAVKLREWRDLARDRKTFYGDCPCSIQEVYQHVDRVQGFYQQCIGLGSGLESPTFVERRRECLSRTLELYESESANNVRCVDGEEWTITKALRRYIWHDRIHAKSIVRTLQRQCEKGLIDEFHDPFKFGTLRTSTRSDLV